MNFRHDDSAIAPLLGFLLLGGASIGVLGSFGWAARQTGNASEQVAVASGSLLAVVLAVTVAGLGAFLVGLSAWRSTVRFVPMGVVLIFLALPFLGLADVFGGAA